MTMDLSEPRRESNSSNDAVVVSAEKFMVSSSHGRDYMSSDLELDSVPSSGTKPRIVEFSPTRRYAMDRRSLKWQELAGRSGRRGSSAVSSVMSSITFNDFDDSIFDSCYGSQRWNLDDTIQPSIDEESRFDSDKVPGKNNNDIPVCPSRRDSLSSGKVSISLRRMRSINRPGKPKGGPPSMPWRRLSSKRLDSKPECPGRQDSLSTLPTDESGTLLSPSSGLVRSSGRRSLC